MDFIKYCSKKCGLSLLPRSCPQKYSIFNSKSASKIFEVEDRLWTQEPAAQIDSTFTEFVANLQVCLKRSYVVNLPVLHNVYEPILPVGRVVNSPYNDLHDTTMI